MKLSALRQTIEDAALSAGRSPEEITLVAVSKGRSAQQIRTLYDQGVRDFGENRVQELLPKVEALPKDIRWHFVGRLQRNKAAKVVGPAALIHSVDTFELAQKLSNVSEQRALRTRVLLEVNTSGEETKAGLRPEQWETLYPKIAPLPGIQVEGVMTMAPQSNDEALVRRCFARARLLAETLALPTLSMGMSSDYVWAIEEGATLVRIGSLLFGDL